MIADNSTNNSIEIVKIFTEYCDFFLLYFLNPDEYTQQVLSKSKEMHKLAAEFTGVFYEIGKKIKEKTNSIPVEVHSFWVGEDIIKQYKNALLNQNHGIQEDGSALVTFLNKYPRIAKFLDAHQKELKKEAIDWYHQFRQEANHAYVKTLLEQLRAPKNIYAPISQLPIKLQKEIIEQTEKDMQKVILSSQKSLQNYFQDFARKHYKNFEQYNFWITAEDILKTVIEKRQLDNSIQSILGQNFVYQATQKAIDQLYMHETFSTLIENQIQNPNSNLLINGPDFKNVFSKNLTLYIENYLDKHIIEATEFKAKKDLANKNVFFDSNENKNSYGLDTSEDPIEDEDEVKESVETSDAEEKSQDSKKIKRKNSFSAFASRSSENIRNLVKKTNSFIHEMKNKTKSTTTESKEDISLIKSTDEFSSTNSKSSSTEIKPQSKFKLFDKKKQKPSYKDFMKDFQPEEIKIIKSSLDNNKGSYIKDLLKTIFKISQDKKLPLLNDFVREILNICKQFPENPSQRAHKIVLAFSSFREKNDNNGMLQDQLNYMEIRSLEKSINAIKENAQARSSNANML